jgi:hypothetical protein
MVADAILNPFDPVIRNHVMPRFVILIHDHPTLHWDFMLEKEANLRTWRLARPPGEAGPIDAEHLADHRLAYLEYEGPLSGNRGSVRRFDGGEYTLVEDADDSVVVELRGSVIKGRAALKRNDKSGGWRLEFIPV